MLKRFILACAIACVCSYAWGQGVLNPTTPLGTSSAGAAIAPVESSAAESSHVLKSSGGNLYNLQVATGATAGWLMLFDATSAPADGAVTPIKCFGEIPASSTVGISWPLGSPPTFVNGIVAVFSSTGCFAKTASATAFFSGEVK